MLISYVKFLFASIFFLTVLNVNAQNSAFNVYLFPGQGSDSRIFREINLSENYYLNYISYPIPEKKTSLKEFALSMINAIDTTKPYILVGHSLGGMICTELCDTLNPELAIIFSSAKSKSELPWRYRFQSKFPIYKTVPKRLIKIGALTLQPIVEPDRNNEKETFKSMLRQKNPKYLKRTIHMIINWERETYSSSIIHVHGNADHTIPIKNVKYNYLIENGSHMMTLTKGKEINDLVNSILKN